MFVFSDSAALQLLRGALLQAFYLTDSYYYYRGYGLV